MFPTWRFCQDTRTLILNTREDTPYTPRCSKLQKMESIAKNKEGNHLTTEEPQAKRWAEQFSEVLNRDAATITADPYTKL